MIRELDQVVLTKPLPELMLEAGDIWHGRSRSRERRWIRS